MADYAIHEETLQDIAGIIRKKDGTQAGIDPATYADRINLMGMLEEKTASGAIATFDDGADDVPIKSLVANLPASLTPYKEINISHYGKNLAKFVNGYGIAGNGTIEPTATRCATIEPIPIIENVTYKVYVDNNRGFIIAVWNGNNLVRRTASISTGGTLDTSGGDRFYLCIYGAAGVTCTIETDKPRCYPSTEANTTYEPYEEPDVYNIEIPNPNPDIFDFAGGSYQRGVWKADGTVNPDEWSCRAYKIPIETGATYDIFGEGFFTLVTYFDANDNFISSETLTKTADFHEAVTIPANCAYLGVSYEGFYVMETKYIKKAFNVYGGSIEAISGEGTSTHNIIDLGSLTWTKRNTSTGHWRFTTQDVPVIINDDSSHIPSMDCIEYTTISPTQTWNGVKGVSCNTAISQLMVCDESYETASDFKAAVSGVYLAYPIITPETFQTEPIAVNSKYGYNNIWNDAGDSEITYRSNGAAEYYPAGEEVSF